MPRRPQPAAAAAARRLLEPGKVFAASVAAIGTVIVLIRPWRGIDLTDEMMYLLAANSGPSEFIHSPWGWHTAPLLRLAGHDVAWLRVLAVIGLSLAAITLVHAARSFAVPRTGEGKPVMPLDMTEAAILSFGAVLWAGLFYLGLLRSPGHNWVAVVGLTLAAAGLLRCLAAARQGRLHRGVLLLTAGLLFALPARPGSVLIAGAVAITVIVFMDSAALALRTTALGAAYGTAAILLLVITRVWPQDFPAIFLRALRTPPLVDQSQVTTAFLAYLRAPLDWWRFIAALQGGRIAAVLLVVGVVLAMIVGLRGAPGHRDRFRRLFVAGSVLPIIALPVIAIAGSRDPVWGFLGYGSMPWGASLFTAVAVGSFLLVLWARLRVQAVSRDPERDAPAERSIAPIVLALLAIAAANGFGTAGSVVGLTTNATGIVAVALLLVTLHLQDGPRARRRSAAVWAVSGALATGVLLTANAENPYRTAPLDQQTHAVRVLQGDLLVDEATRDRFADVRATATAAGFREGDRLIPLKLPWSTFPPVALSAEVMPTLVPTIFQYGRSVEMGEFNLRLLDGAWEDAWVIVDRDRGTGRYERFGWQIAGMEERLQLATGRTFPEDYVCVGEGATIQLWLPVRTGAGAVRGACDYVPPVP